MAPLNGGVLELLSERLPFAVPVAPFKLSGTVYGTLLNHKSAMAALGEKLRAPPYNEPPNAPVLYLKPRNTLAVTGERVVIPQGVSELAVGACLGLFIGSTATRLSEARALEAVSGYVIVNDISVPHSDYYRPSVRYIARDGFCPVGPVSPRAAINDPDALRVRTWVDGREVQVASTRDLIRPIRRLLTDVTEFMTLAPGDILTVGTAAPAPMVRSGQSVRVEIDGLQSLFNYFVNAA
jgi:5-oxopent-3-ene-1,2,5-tricarboxylate decarboxylase / 2-hydroxyhepta-2,4-diene-1,7-dioate isomerase